MLLLWLILISQLLALLCYTASRLAKSSGQQPLLLLLMHYCLLCCPDVLPAVVCESQPLRHSR
jgi:hypothetical protein